MSVPLRAVIAATGITAVITIVVIAVRAGFPSTAETGRPVPADETSVQSSPTAHRPESPPDRTYWTEERMRSARPAPAPTQE